MRIIFEALDLCCVDRGQAAGGNGGSECYGIPSEQSSKLLTKLLDVTGGQIAWSGGSASARPQRTSCKQGRGALVHFFRTRSPRLRCGFVFGKRSRVMKASGLASSGRNDECYWLLLTQKSSRLSLLAGKQSGARIPRRASESTQTAHRSQHAFKYQAGSKGERLPSRQ